MPGKSLTFFCPACWADVAFESGVCPHCGADMEAVQRGRDFVDKLIAALDHPEPETRARAALILGLRKEKRAVEPLLRVVREGKDASLMEAALEALGRLGEPRCRAALEMAAIRGTLRVRLAARRALSSLGAPLESNDERH